MSTLIHPRFSFICEKVQTLKSAILDFYGAHLQDPDHSSSLEGQKRVWD